MHFCEKQGATFFSTRSVSPKRTTQNDCNCRSPAWGCELVYLGRKNRAFLIFIFVIVDYNTTMMGFGAFWMAVCVLIPYSNWPVWDARGNPQNRGQTPNTERPVACCFCASGDHFCPCSPGVVFLYGFYSKGAMPAEPILLPLLLYVYGFYTKGDHGSDQRFMFISSDHPPRTMLLALFVYGFYTKGRPPTLPSQTHLIFRALRKGSIRARPQNKGTTSGPDQGVPQTTRPCPGVYDRIGKIRSFHRKTDGFPIKHGKK